MTMLARLPWPFLRIMHRLALLVLCCYTSTSYTWFYVQLVEETKQGVKSKHPCNISILLPLHARRFYDGSRRNNETALFP